MISETLIQQAATMLRQSKRPCVLTGAGVSKELGIPTFRDALEGLWARFNPQELATPQAFTRDPKLVWDFYEYRRELMRPAKPNNGHKALAALEQRFPRLPIITQNIDTLHEEAGSTNVISLHGKIAANKCFYNCQGDPTLVDVSTIEWDKTSGPPPCPHCGRAMVRPNVVWFSEMLSPLTLGEAKRVIHNTDLMLVIGTSGVVMPASDMPQIAKAHGAKVIEINPDASMVTRIADIWLQGPSGEVMPRVVELVMGAE